jgi:hypothetical protein
MNAQSEPDIADAAISPAQQPRHAPPVRPLDAALREVIVDHASEIYRDLPGFQRDLLQNVYVTLSYKDADDGAEKLLSLATTLPDPDEEVELKEGSLGNLLRIPVSQDRYTAEIKHAITIYSASPDQQTPCGQSGGTNYCNF